MTAPRRTIVTAALPYANGSLHMGHLVEYTLTDIYVRALNQLGHKALYICASDAHGTPIELNAKKRNVAPMDMVKAFHEEHRQEFARYDIIFDYFGSTHDDYNKTLTQDTYKALEAKDFIVHRDVDGNYCPKDKRFLPDRFVRGTCPRCRAEDQYGDVCEKCNATYAPTDLIAPTCALCGTVPQIKQSRHAFFKLSRPDVVQFLRGWIDSGALQADVANYVRQWIIGGLKDWCISRDGPYFGFAIPDLADKYFYVWMDAPLGYVSSSCLWGTRNNVSQDALWRSEDTHIEHVIGKDIMYFHTLFWPAVLNAVGMSRPKKIHVHGMLTVNGEKMSKSRGTFILAKTFADHIDPQALRYYYASKLTPQSHDIDLSFEDFVLRVNSELVNKYANLFSRVGKFVEARLDSALGCLPFKRALLDRPATSEDEGSMLCDARRVITLGQDIEAAYLERDFAQVTRLLAAMADIGNEAMQRHTPWDLIKTNVGATRQLCTFVVNVCHALGMYLAPIVPRFAEQALKMLNDVPQPMQHSRLFRLENARIGEVPRLFERIDIKAIDAIVAPSRQEAQPSQTRLDPSCDGGANNAQTEGWQPKAVAKNIDVEAFGAADLRVGRIVSAERVQKSKKLLVLQIDIGEAKPRQVVSGIAQAHAPESLVDAMVVIVANLTPATIMGLESQGMLLSADGPRLQVLTLQGDVAAGSRVC